MSALDLLPPLREVVAQYALAPKKQLGQNFLFDLNLTGKIARSSGSLEGVICIEVGAGPGGLTRALLAQGAKHVVAIERDERCLNALSDIAKACPTRLTVINDDALQIDMTQLSRLWSQQGPVRIIANLPYNIGTELLTSWLESEPWPISIETMVLMFQKEVAERIVATPKQRKNYGRLAILAGWRTKARILFDVPAAAFTPPPKVTSSIVELTINPHPLSCSRKILSQVTQAAFGQRRKMLRQSLKSLCQYYPALNIETLLQTTDISPTARAEEVDIVHFISLANQLATSRA